MKTTCAGTDAALSRRGFLKGAAAFALTTVAAPMARLVGEERPTPAFVENRCGFFVLPGGRRLAYAEYGDPTGKHVVINHHGLPSCRWEAELFLDVLRSRRGIRMFGLDRPGIGRSDPDPNGSFLTWSADLTAFADAQRLERFALTSTSGGTPYALATACALPDRVTTIALGCPMAPLEAADITHSSGARGILLAQQHPIAARIALARFSAEVQRHPGRIPISFLTLGPADRAVLDEPAERRLFTWMMTEAFHQGPAEIGRAAALLAEPWACWLKEVKQKVVIFQGNSDRVATPAMARYLAETLPNAEARFFPGEGHLSLTKNWAAEILSAVVPAS